MAIDLTGIHNANEFYTSHYLVIILEGDLKDLFKKWEVREREENLPAPYHLLMGLRRDFHKMRSQLERERNPEKRLEQQRLFFQQFLPALGYSYNPDLKELDDCSFLPLIGEVKKTGGAPELWIIDVINPPGEMDDPLLLTLSSCQYPGQDEVASALLQTTLDEIITKHIFGRSEPPRWVILMNDIQVVLIDRGKWNEKRLMRFDLSEIFNRNEFSTLKATAALLHRESLCPVEGMSLLDTLNENSHKHAFAVSEDLKYALREAVELLGNEVVYYLTEIRKKGVYSGEEKLDAKQLTKECLRFMYRLLFLFYIEARPELGYSPLKAEAYRLGYSLESLRDLELVKLTTEESGNGYFIHESLQLLFELIYNGFHASQLIVDEVSDHNVFSLRPLHSHLFDPGCTPILNKVKFHNLVLQKVIELMSLSRPRNSKERRGRISYSQLGINQLGAVYEALLCYQCFFAEDDLYEVKKKDEPYN